MNKVLIVDEHPITRFSTRMLLTQEGFEVIAEADNGADALERIERYHPDIIILEMTIEKIDAITLIRRIKKMPSPACVVVFTAQGSKFQIADCIKAGVDGYVYKTAQFEELVKAVRATQTGYKYFPSEAFPPNLDDECQTLKNLSSRERQVLEQLTAGRRNKEIAERMVLSDKTISTYKRRLLKKFRAENLLELTMLAKRAGMRVVSGS